MVHTDTGEIRLSEPLPGDEGYPIVVPTAPADEHTWVLKHDETFAVLDHGGDIRPSGLGEQGLYYNGTRHLSRLTLNLGHQRLLFLSAGVSDDSVVLTGDLTNPDLVDGGYVTLPHGTVHVARSTFLWRGVCYTRVRVRTYGLTRAAVSFFVQFQADFVDIFEVRGATRERRGRRLEEGVEDGQVVLAYEGLDGVIRRTRLVASPPPAAMSRTAMRFDLELDPHAATAVVVAIACDTGDAVAPLLPYDTALAQATEARRTIGSGDGAIITTNEAVNDWLQRSLADLRLLISETEHGPYPYAGVPWFSTAFGRDGIITALETIWLYPGLARGVLRYLAATQAAAVNPEQEAELGKILHETRQGEMAALKEIPFGCYYGSVDATPLFVLLAGAYYERTGDRDFIAALWPHVELALRWIDTDGDRDGDGFVEYLGTRPTGLLQQGWKDSPDSVSHGDGRLAEGPIALCEVQGYVYAARMQAAELAAMLGQDERAADLRRQALVLQERFEAAFWCEELGLYALALDGAKEPCRVRSSNAGHCLFSGIAHPDRARRVADVLLSDVCFSGWGVRTLATTEPRYNPMSYHNGSVWPHDNAMIAAGLARYGFKEHALKIMTALFDASRLVDLNRLPELYCGFPRQPGQGLTLYPVACSPQAWAAGAVFLLLQAVLGLSFDLPRRQLRFTEPMLPEWLPSVRIANLRVGEATIDLALQRRAGSVDVQVLKKRGPLDIVITAREEDPGG